MHHVQNRGRGNAFLVFAIILSLLVFLLGCASTPTLSTAVPSSQPPTTTTPSSVPPASTSSPPTSLGPILNTWGWESSANISLTGGQVVYFPDNGASVDSGRTLTITWDANGTLTVFLLNSAQYLKFSAGQGIPDYVDAQQGSKGSFTYYVASAETYYVLIRNVYQDAETRVYTAEMTER